MSLFRLNAKTEDKDLFYFFINYITTCYQSLKKKKKKNMFLDSEQGVPEMAKMEEQRIRTFQNEVASCLHLLISASSVYLFIYFPRVLSLIHLSLCKFSHSCQAKFPLPNIIMFQAEAHKDGEGRRAAYKYFHIVGIVKD